MKKEALEALVKEVLPFHENVLNPAYKKIKFPYQRSIEGINFFPSISQRLNFMGSFYERLTRGLYGGKLNDIRFDIALYNGNNGSASIKPDILDNKNDIHWESKSNCFDKECEIMKRQLDGYKFLQYTNPKVTYLISIYRHTLQGIRKIDRTEKEVFDGLVKGTAFSVILPLSVVLKIRENPISGDTLLARNYVSRNNNWPDCMCIRPHTINRFLINPRENFELLGFDSERFEIERHLSPKNIFMNNRRIRQFPIVKVIDKEYRQWVDQFMMDYEMAMESEDAGIADLPIFETEEDMSDIPFG